MKRILIVVDEANFDYLKKIKDKNNHTWEQCLYAYADMYNEED